MQVSPPFVHTYNEVNSSPLCKEVKQERNLRARKKKQKQKNEKERGEKKEEEIRKIK